MLTKSTKTILETIAAQTAEYLNRRADSHSLNISLLGGDFGAVCFLCEYSRIAPRYSAVAETLLDAAMASIGRWIHIPTYCNGLGGMALGLTLLEEDGLIQDASASLGDIDWAIHDSLSPQLAEGNIDFLHGAVGAALYFERRHNAAPILSEKALAETIDHLYVNKISSNGTFHWTGTPDTPGRSSNISLSHGMSSIVVLLSRVVIDKSTDRKHLPRARELLLGAVNYILSQQLPAPSAMPNLFPSTCLDDSDAGATFSRLAWCYGDLGVALGLLYASRALHDKELDDKARHIILHSCHRRDFPDTLLYDCCVCHGIAGVYLMMDSFAQVWDDSLIKDTALYWRRRLTAIFDDHAPCCYMHYDTAARRLIADYSILDGISGIGLALMPRRRFIRSARLLP